MAKWKIIPQSQIFAARADRELCKLYGELSKTHDFSKATAKAHGFRRPVEPLSKAKSAKTGGEMLNGTVAAQLYLSYNGAHGRIAITAQLDRDRPISAARWIVTMPEANVQLIGDTPVGNYWGMPGTEFPDSQKELAWALYSELAAAVVPKHNG
jgi:hypothetical protein